MASAKIKHTKITRIINDNVVWGRLSENYLTRKFIARHICDAKYSRFVVFIVASSIATAGVPDPKSPILG